MSQFTIAADGRGALRLASVDLSPPDEGYTVDAGRTHTDEVQVRPSALFKNVECSVAEGQTVKQGQPLSRIYKIRPTQKQDGERDW
jgi:hypothetical protein